MKAQLKRARAEQSSALASAGRGAAEAWGAQKELARDQHLYAAGAIARASMDEAQVKIRAGGASAGEGAGRAEASGATAEDLEWKINHAEIKAPFTGQISMVKAKEGEVVGDGAPIARIFNPSDLIVRFAVPASDKRPIKPGDKVELKIGNQDPIWAVVMNVADEIEPPITYRIVEADIDDSKLRPGEVTMSATGHVKLAQASSKPTKGNSR
jgi:HlyD family secretion protein